MGVRWDVCMCLPTKVGVLPLHLYGLPNSNT